MTNSRSRRSRRLARIRCPASGTSPERKERRCPPSWISPASRPSAWSRRPGMVDRHPERPRSHRTRTNRNPPLPVVWQPPGTRRDRGRTAGQLPRALLRPRLRRRHRAGGARARGIGVAARLPRVPHRLRRHLGRVGERDALLRAPRARGRPDPNVRLHPDGDPRAPRRVHGQGRERHGHGVRGRPRRLPRRDDVARGTRSAGRIGPSTGRARRATSPRCSSRSSSSRSAPSCRPTRGSSCGPRSRPGGSS